MSTLFLKDPKVQRMVDRHGNDAVAVSLALMAEAMVQEHGGEVELTYRQLANDASTDRNTAFEIVETAVEVGLLARESGDDFEFMVKFPAWSRHQAAFRKAKSRAARKPHEQANVTPSHEQVTPGHKKSPTRQDRTRQERTQQDKEKASGKPSDFDEWLTDYRQVTGKDSVRGSKPARTAFDARVRDGYSLEDLKQATRGCHGDQFCRDNGHDVPETILRASKVERYIALSKQGPKQAPGIDRANHFARRAQEAA